MFSQTFTHLLRRSPLTKLLHCWSLLHRDLQFLSPVNSLASLLLRPRSLSASVMFLCYLCRGLPRGPTFYGGLVGQARISFRSFRRHSLNVAIPSELCLLYVILGVIHVQSCLENIVSDYVTPCFALNSSLKRFSEYIVMKVM